jgi:transposase
MRRSGRLLTDAQWQKIEPLLPRSRKHPRGGRPPANDRKVLEGILWMLRSGARWQDLPEEFPSPSTCWRRRDWEEQEVWLEIWRAFLGELNERQQLNGSEAFWDGSFAPALPAALDRGTYFRLARQLPPPGRPLRPLAHDVWGVLPYRLLHDRLAESFEMTCTIGAGIAEAARSHPAGT